MDIIVSRKDRKSITRDSFPDDVERKYLFIFVFFFFFSLFEENFCTTNADILIIYIAIVKFCENLAIGTRLFIGSTECLTTNTESRYSGILPVS